MEIGLIIQARTTSSRLPKKVLKDLPYGSGFTVLEQVIRRLKKAKYVEEIIVATTISREDDEITEVSTKEGIRYFRGSPNDVLDRYYHAASEFSLDIVVRITGDCPCIDPQIVDSIIDRHIQNNADYTSNTLKRTYPHGLDVEVFNFEVLEKSFEEAKEALEREHVTPYMYKSGRFKIQNIETPVELKRPDIRITLDTKEDYALLCAIYDFLYYENPFFGAKEIIDLFYRKPWLKYINENIAQKKIFDNLEDEVKEAIKVLDLQDLKRARDFISELLTRGL